jgi:glycosyltransferase involved in cell wall biosynthesis
VNILVVHETCGWQGGVEQHLAVTVPALRARGHRVTLAWRAASARGADRFQALFDASHPVAALGLAETCPGFDEIVDRERPDAIYVHKLPRLPARLLDGRAARVVRYVHDHDLTCPRRHRYTAFSRSICRAPAGLRCWFDAAFVARPGPLPGNLRLVDLRGHAAELARNHALDALLVGSRAMRDELLANGFSPERVHVVAPVLPRPPLAPAPVPVEPRVLFVGQLVAGKGVDLLLEALRRVPGPWCLDVVGEGNARPALEASVARLRLTDRVRFVGWRDYDVLAQLYASARVVAVPSRWAEPFGMIGLEAMHAARAVVAFDVGGIPDWCAPEVTGLLAPENDVPALAAALSRALYEPGLAERLGASGRARVEGCFTFEGMVDALEVHLRGGA